MDDYAALVERVCFTLPKVTGCLLLSDDGLVLSAYPDDGNRVAETAWLHFCALGEPIRSFVAFVDQVWVYVRHGPYAAFVVAGSGVRPGVLVDQLEQVLTDPRISLPREAFGVPEPPRRPSAPFVGALPGVAEARDESPSAPTIQEDPAEAETPAPVTEPPAPVTEPSDPEAETPDPVTEPPDPSTAPEAARGSWRPVPAADPTEDEEGEIDRVQLAQEFSGLLQMHRADDEASS